MKLAHLAAAFLAHGLAPAAPEEPPPTPFEYPGRDRSSELSARFEPAATTAIPAAGALVFVE